ncbi:MAG: hypothetical protein ACI9J4_000901 [Paraglaciecola sp.]|jgi:hypothetical protein
MVEYILDYLLLRRLSKLSHYLFCVAIKEQEVINMTHDLPLPMYKKLTVTFRVEPGCLGPDGIERIEGFCKFAKKEVIVLDSDFIRWVITPRYDKALLETEYKTNNKRLDHDKAEKYLRVFGKELDDFEEHLQDKLSILIEQYLGR